MSSFSIKYIYREMNKVMDYVAKYVQNEDCTWIGEDHIPIDMYFLLQADQWHSQIM